MLSVAVFGGSHLDIRIDQDDYVTHLQVNNHRVLGKLPSEIGELINLKELELMSKQASHYIPRMELPEKSWIYRLAKKYMFFGFGAYG